MIFYGKLLQGLLLMDCYGNPYYIPSNNGG